MGLWTHKDSPRERPPAPIVIDRKIIRFRRLVEQHGEVLDTFADLKEKQSGEYILDRRYIEARLDRAYEGIRRILYDMHVISESNSAEGYDDLDRLRAVSEKILKDAREASKQQAPRPSAEEGTEWETLALQALFQDLTRAPVYGTGSASGASTALAAPESLTEWAGWAHLKAAQWLTDHLPSISPAPLATLVDQETGLYSLQVFVLGGLRDAEATISDSLTRKHPDQTDPTSLLPLRVFLEGLNSSPDGASTQQFRLEKGNTERPGGQMTQLQLYAGEDFLLLRLPPFLPLRLFCCALGMEPDGQRLYLCGTSFSPLFNQGSREPFLVEKQPFPAYRCLFAGRWLSWASHFSWAQGEERIRMLGHALAAGMTVHGGEGTEQDVNKCLQESIVGFLKQTATPQREVP